MLALDVHENMTVLDMCSAPGGKAALVAALSGIETRIIANEPNDPRMQKLQLVMELLGVKNVSYTQHHGKQLPAVVGKETCDRVLVDAECSTEAEFNFKSKAPLGGWNLDRVTRLMFYKNNLLWPATTS